MQIRKALPGEEERVLQFYHDLIDDMKDMEFRPAWIKGVYPAQKDIADAIAQGAMYVADEDGFIAAAVLNHAQGEGYELAAWKTDAPADRCAVIHILAVSPRTQGQGIGRKMLAFLREECVRAGDAVIRLDTLPWNKPGRMLYEHFGFSWCGDIELDYPSTGRIPFSMYEMKV